MRILIGLVLALSVSLACDQPYEDVGGYKIGCPFIATDEFLIKSDVPELNAREYIKKIDGIFDAVVVGVVNGNIEMLNFSKDDGQVISKSNINDMLSALQKRWGKYGEQDELLPDFYQWDVSENDVIGKIIFSSSGSDVDSKNSYFYLIYYSQKLLDFQRDAQKIMKEKRDKELSTY